MNPPSLPHSSSAENEIYRDKLSVAIADGWIVISEGSSGAQMQKAKVMRGTTVALLILGFLLLAFYGFGLLVIIAALVDFWNDKKQTLFITRT